MSIPWHSYWSTALTCPAKTSSAQGSSTLFQAYFATGGPIILGSTHHGIEQDILGLVIITVTVRRTER